MRGIQLTTKNKIRFLSCCCLAGFLAVAVAGSFACFGRSLGNDQGAAASLKDGGQDEDAKGSKGESNDEGSLAAMSRDGHHAAGTKSNDSNSGGLPAAKRSLRNREDSSVVTMSDAAGLATKIPFYFIFIATPLKMAVLYIHSHGRSH